jgi:hypothetical protein
MRHDGIFRITPHQPGAAKGDMDEIRIWSRSTRRKGMIYRSGVDKNFLYKTVMVGWRTKLRCGFFRRAFLSFDQVIN